MLNAGVYFSDIVEVLTNWHLFHVPEDNDFFHHCCCTRQNSWVASQSCVDETNAAKPADLNEVCIQYF